MGIPTHSSTIIDSHVWEGSMDDLTSVEQINWQHQSSQNDLERSDVIVVWIYARRFERRCRK